MPRVVSVCVHPSVWSPTSLCAAATAPPTTASASCTCGPAKNRWTSEWSARESAVSDACLPAARAHVAVACHACCVLIAEVNTMTINLSLNETRTEWITKSAPFWERLLQQGVDCIAIRKGSVTSLWIPFQKSISWRVGLSKQPLCIAAFPGNDLALTCALCLTQKRAAALFVPGVPDASGTSASAHSAQARPSQRSAAATAPLTTTSANCARRPACRRGGLTWSSTAAAMKVGNGPGDCVITLNQLATETV